MLLGLELPVASTEYLGKTEGGWIPGAGKTDCALQGLWSELSKKQISTCTLRRGMTSTGHWCATSPFQQSLSTILLPPCVNGTNFSSLDKVGANPKADFLLTLNLQKVFWKSSVLNPIIGFWLLVVSLLGNVQMLSVSARFAESFDKKLQKHLVGYIPSACPINKYILSIYKCKYFFNAVLTIFLNWTLFLRTRLELQSHVTVI